jgi:hypothetical protein
MSNYTKNASIGKDFLSPVQLEFIDKVHRRYFKTSKLKRELFDFWDNYFPDDAKVDGRVIKSMKHYEDLKEKILACGSFTEYRVVPGSDRIKLVRANFCRKDKVCLSCAVGRAYNQQKKFLQALEVYPYENDDSLLDKYWYYIVTPVRHSLDESLDVVYSRADKLRKSALKQMRNSKSRKSGGFWSQFNGGMGSVEVTHTKNGWNVHINWIVNSDNRVNNIREVTDGKKVWYQSDDLEAFLNRFNNSYIHSINELDFSSKEAIRKNLLEVLKYALKFSSLEPQHLIYIYYYFYRKRLFFTFGNLRGLDLEAIDDVTIGDDIKDYEDFVRLIYIKLNDDSYRFFCSLPKKN